MQKRISVMVGHRLKELRESRKLTQAEPAERARKSVETISNIERGKTTPSLKTLAGFADILKYDLANFFAPAPQTKPEVELSARFRQLSTDDQRLLCDFVDLLERHRRTAKWRVGREK
jgi:transcriptional regulator with XRE-family HTH domain